MNPTNATINLQDARILIVDDQEANIRLLEGVLRRACYTNITAITDPRQALAAAKSLRPDVILLDLMMPHLDGFEVMQQFKSQLCGDGSVPVIVLTADATPQAKRKALELGARDFLTKPFDHTEVLLRIRNLLEMRAMHLDLQRQNSTLESQVLLRTEDLRHLLRQLVEAQEMERRRLAMDLHDGPLQSLGVSILAVSRAILRQGRGEHEIVAGELKELRKALTGTVEEVRATLADLSVDTLAHSGLAAALQKHIKRYSDLTSIQVTLEHSIPGRLPQHIELLLYRLAQEALSNVRKHSQARNVTVSLKQQSDGINVTVSDDGIGFDIAAALAGRNDGQGMGLRSMSQRIRNARGDLTITSPLGRGTTLSFWCPLDEGASAGQGNIPHNGGPHTTYPMESSFALDVAKQ